MIDGSLIPLEQRPEIDGANDYFARKQGYSSNIMAVCDDKKRLRALVTGWPGAVDDQRIFDMCPVCCRQERPYEAPLIGLQLAVLPRALENGLLSVGQYLLADGGYRVMRHVIVPYDRMSGQTLPKGKESWNFHLSRCRMAIEHT